MSKMYQVEVSVNNATSKGNLIINDKYMVLAIGTKSRIIRYEELDNKNIIENELVLILQNGRKVLIKSEKIYEIFNAIVDCSIKYSNSEEQLSLFYLIIALLYPVIGVLMWCVMYNKHPYNAKNIAKVSFASFLFSGLIVFLFIIFFRLSTS